MSNKIVRGTLLLTGATFLSKFLGMIYVIPFNELVGEKGGTLYAFAYTPYNILITFSTIGVPLAVSKFVSKYNSLQDYRTGIRVFRAGMILMAFTGLLAFLFLFFGAETLATMMLKSDDNSGITIAEVKMVLRMVSFALLIIPSMSIVRGFFQGYQSMGPTAVSQVMEQIVRIVFLLVSAFVVMKIYNGTIATAVGFATFAAFVGALASCAVLFMYWQRRKRNIQQLVQSQTFVNDAPLKELFIELFSYAGAFILVGLATPLYQLTDQFTFKRAMVAIGQGDLWELSFATINFYGHKLIIIPVTIATGLSLAILPALTSSFTKNKLDLLHQQINQALQIVLVLVVPAFAGLIMLSDVIYGALYGLGDIEITSTLMAWYAPVSLLFALFTVSSSILQGINQQRFAVISLGAGLLAKILLNIQLIYMFGAKGAIFGTALAAGTAVVLNLTRIRKSINFSFRQVRKRSMLVIILTTIMCLVIWGLKTVCGLFLPYLESRFAAVIMVIIGVGIGGGVYLWLAYQSTLLEHVFGDRVKGLERFIRKI